jgi:carbonic anhydrase/acetyltransferase-like protein (isoleucine patch superfamily)
VGFLFPFRGKAPRVASDVFLAPTATVIGDVTLGSRVSVWSGAVLRGDHPEHGIAVGPGSNIQDNCVIHVGDWQPTVIGAGVTVGHGAMFESCTVEDGCVIGMNAVLLQEAHIGRGSLVAAGTVVLEGSQIPPGSLVAGVPGKVRGSLGASASEWVRRSGAHYAELSREYLAQGLGAPVFCGVCGGPVLEGGRKTFCLGCGHLVDSTFPGGIDPEG